jgi:hypothetical protein
VSSKKILQQQENKKGRNSLNSFLPVCLCIPSTHRKRRKEENIKKDDQLYIERRPEHVSFLFSLLNQLFLYIYLYTFILIFWMRIYIKSTERERERELYIFCLSSSIYKAPLSLSIYIDLVLFPFFLSVFVMTQKASRHCATYFSTFFLNISYCFLYFL